MNKESTSNFYIINDETAQKSYVEVRRADKWLSFIMPHLAKGFSVLDCGCGVGSLTLDIAERVAPGKVLGVDMDERQLAVARTEACRRNLTNVSFAQGDVYALAYPDATFDAALAHTLLIHLDDPLRALKEFHRLVKPGGVVGISDDDWGTAVRSPESPLSRKSLDLMTKVIQHNGGNPFYSRHLRGLMLQAGFARSEGFALAPEHYGTAAETRRIASVVNGVLRTPAVAGLIFQQGWATKEEVDTMVDYNVDWSNQPDAFYAVMYCAAVGWKARLPTSLRGIARKAQDDKKYTLDVMTLAAEASPFEEPGAGKPHAGLCRALHNPAYVEYMVMGSAVAQRRQIQGA